MEKTFLQALNLYRAKSALQISPSPELALVFVSLAPSIPGMENKMPDKNSKKYQWEKKLTASFNFEGALEVAAAAAALAQGREELVSGSDGTLPSWYRDPTKTGRDGSAKTIGFYRPKDQPKTPKVRYFLGITENKKDKQGNKIGISLEYPDLFKIARVMEEAALAILGWRKDIEGLIWARTLNDRRKKDPTHPLLSATLDQYLAKEAADSVALTGLLKKKMALTPEFGHVIGIGKSLVVNGSIPKLTVAVARMIDDEKELLQTFWQRLSAFTKERGIPTFVTWNGLGFTFPFLIERSTALGVEPSCILPRARFQPWKHLDLFAELAAYDPHRYMSLQSRLSLWRLSLNGNGSEHHFGDHDLLTETWRKGNPKPLEENLKLTIGAIQQILNRVAPCFLEGRNYSH